MRDQFDRRTLEIFGPRRGRSSKERVLSDAGPADVILANGRASGVRTASGQAQEADVVVVATGSGVPGMAAKVGRRIGDGTTRALLVLSKPIRHPLRAVLNTPRVAIRGRWTPREAR